MGETLIAGLKPGTTYQFQVIPINSLDQAGPPQPVVEHTTPEDEYAPPVPTIIEATSIGWLVHVVVDNVIAADLAGYEFHASTSSGFTPDASTLVQQGNSTTCEFMGTANSQRWYIKVCSYDTSGNKSSYTARSSAQTAAYDPDDTTAPATPTGLSLSTGVEMDVDGHQIVYILASWAANAESDFANYEIRYRKGSETYAYMYSSVNAVKISGLIGNTSYAVSLRAYDRNSNASGWCTAKTITSSKDTTGPSVPTSAAASSFLSTIHLTWTNPTNADFDHVNIYRSDTSSRGAASLIAQVSGTGYVDRIGLYDVTRYYWIAAVDTSGNASSTEAGPVNASTAGVQATDIDSFAITASKMFAKIPILESDSWTNNSPGGGSVAWNAHKLYYNGVEYSITAGNTSYKYIYWVSGSTAYSSSDTHPTLTDGDFIIATNVLGVHDLAWNAIANQVIGTAYIQDLAVTNAKILDLSVEKLTAGAITSKTITLAITAGGGDVKIQAGKTSFTDTTAGFILGIDDAVAGDPTKFIVGDATHYFKWDGANLSWKGANAELSAAGVLTASDVLISGGSVAGFTSSSADGFYAGTGATRVQMKAGSGIWTGAEAIGSAPFSVTNAGVLTAKSGTIGGWKLGATTLSSGDLSFDSASPRIQCGSSGTNYVRIEPAGIKGVSSTLGTTFDLPSDGSAPTFSSGTIKLTTYELQTSGAIKTCANPATSGGVLINKDGIRGYSSTPTENFKLDASTGTITAVDATLSGAVTANTGYIGGTSGWVISSKTITGGSGSDSKIIAGILESNDWGTSDGSQINLYSKTIKFGGSSAPKFSVAADGTLTCTGATITGDFKTHASVGSSHKGVHLDVSNNELYFWGDRGDTTIEKLCSIGVNTASAYDEILTLGSSTANRCCAVIQNNGAITMYVQSHHSSFPAIYADSPWKAIVGNSASGVGVQGHSGGSNPGVYGYNSSTGPGVIGSSSSGYAMYANGDMYVVDDCSANTFTDHTPYYEGDALAELRLIRGKDGKIDHDTLPAFTRRQTTVKTPVMDVKTDQQKKNQAGEGEYEDVPAPGRDLGATVSMLVVAIQQLADRLDQSQQGKD